MVFNSNGLRYIRKAPRSYPYSRVTGEWDFGEWGFGEWQWRVKYEPGGSAGHSAGRTASCWRTDSQADTSLTALRPGPVCAGPDKNHHDD